MRIGIYNPRVGIAESGGTETFLREIMKRLAPNHTIVLLTGAGDLHPEVATLDIKIEQVPFTRKESHTNEQLTSLTPLLPAEVESLTMFWDAFRSGVLNRMGRTTDVVSTHYYLDNALVSRALDTPTIFRFPGIKQPSIRWRAMCYVATPTLYLSNSRSTQRRIERWLDLHVDGIVYAGVDTDRFNPEITPAFEETATTILYVGRLDEGKGLRDLVDGTRQIDNATVHIVGDGVLEAELEERAIERGVSDSIVFHGSVSHEEIHHYYAAADVFCLPSYHESLGIVNLEAMATGVPVVSTRIDAIQEYLTDGENGLLFEPGEVEGLVGALKQLIRSPGLRAELGLAGRETALDFSWEEQARRLEGYYERAVDQLDGSGAE